jgi:hypothetical protein
MDKSSLLIPIKKRDINAFQMKMRALQSLVTHSTQSIIEFALCSL